MGEIEKSGKIEASEIKVWQALKHQKTIVPNSKPKLLWKPFRGKLTINELSKQFSVHPTQIAKWKKQFLENLPQIFDNVKKPQADQDEELINQLYSQIGQMKVELDWLKKKSTLFQLKFGGNLSSREINKFPWCDNVNCWESIGQVFIIKSKGKKRKMPF